MSIETQVDENTLFVEEDMPESQSQVNASDELKQVLEQQYRLEQCFITGNLAIYPPKDKAYPFINVAPDVMVFKGIRLSQEEQVNLSSWKMSEANRPAPNVVFEISSEGTWSQDLNLKPNFYRLLGVKEYFAYDPQEVWTRANRQLRGWRYLNNQMEELQPDERGWLWSIELNSWLVPDGAYLRLYDAELNPRLTGQEAERAAKEAERAAKEAERAAKEAALQAEQEARQSAEQAQQSAQEALLREQEAQQRAQEALLREQQARQREQEALQREQALLERLRKANIDPDSL